jgi:hypothetical protein
MKKPYVEGNKLVLSKTYMFGSKEISELTFGELTAKEMGEMPLGEKQKFKEFYPIVCMLTGVAPGFLDKLGRDDIMKAVEHTTFLLAS